MTATTYRVGTAAVVDTGAEIHITLMGGPPGPCTSPIMPEHIEREMQAAEDAAEADATD